MRRPIRVSGFAGTMAVAVAVIAAKAQLGDEPVKLSASTTPRRIPTTTPLTPTTAVLGRVVGAVNEQPFRERVTTATTVVGVAPVAQVRTIRGDSIATGYGPVEVAVTLDGTRIVDVQTLEYPDDDAESVEINDEALPILRQQVLDAQSSDIQGLSGATYTAIGYALSVQSALDRA